MKKLFVLFPALFLFSALSAQSFQISLSPDTLSINQGQNGVFSISAVPSGGFNASIQLSTLSKSCLADLTISPPLINSPYNGQLTVGSTSVLMPGDYKVYIKGVNGPAESSDSAVLHINYNSNMHWTFYNIYNSALTYNTVTAVAIDHDNNIWVGVHYYSGYGNAPGCLAKFDRYNWEVWSYNDHFTTDYCGQVLSQDNNSIIPGDGSINCIKIDKNNVKWIGTPDGLIRYDDATWNIYLQGENVTSIAFDAKNNIWVACYNDGIRKYDGSTWTSYTTSNSLLPSNYVGSLAIQYDSILWAATVGVAKFDGVFWTIFNASNSPVPTDGAHEIEVDMQNKVLVASGANGLLMYDGVNWSALNHANSGLSANMVYAIFVDSNNVYWLGAQKYATDQTSGLNKYDGSTWQLFNSSNSGMPLNMFYPSVPNDLVYAINKDMYGTIWMGVWGGGLAAYDENNLAAHFMNVPEIRNNPNKDISVYPNPSLGLFTITNLKDLLYIEVTGLNGQSIYKEKINDKNTASVQIRLNNIPGGMYFVKLIGENRINIKKVIIE